MSLNAYIIHLMYQGQMGMFDSMQIAEKISNRLDHCLRIYGGNITFKDGHTIHCKTKLETRKAIIPYLAQDSKSLAQYR